jgi:hypothetical protein
MPAQGCLLVGPSLSRCGLDGVRAERNKIRNLAPMPPHPPPTLAPHERAGVGPPWVLHDYRTRRGMHYRPLSLSLACQGQHGSQCLGQQTPLYCLAIMIGFGGSQQTLFGTLFVSPRSLTVVIVPRPGNSDDKITCSHVSRRASRLLQTTMKHQPGSGLTVPQLVSVLKQKLRRTVQHETYVLDFSPPR